MGAATSRPIPFAYPQGVVLSAISRTSTLYSLARTRTSTMPSAARQPITADQDFVLGVVDCADGEGSTVRLRREADCDDRARGDRRGRQCWGKDAEGARQSDREHVKVTLYGKLTLSYRVTRSSNRRVPRPCQRDAPPTLASGGAGRRDLAGFTAPPGWPALQLRQGRAARTGC